MKILICLLPLMHLNSAQSLKVLNLFMVIRHGSRAPSNLTPHFINIGVTQPLQLTKTGKNEQFTLASSIKQAYPFLNLAQSIFLSSSKSRCRDSMHNFKLGLNFQFDLQTFILPENYVHQKILMNISKKKQEFVNKSYVIKINLINEIALKNGYTEIKDFYCPKCSPSITPFEILIEMRLVDGTVTCFISNKLTAKVIKKRLLKQLETAFRLLYYTVIFKTKKEAALYCQENLRLLGKSIINSLSGLKVGKILHKKYIKFYNNELPVSNSMFIFAHDGNLMSILRLLVGKKSLILEEIFRPPFSAFIKFEVFKNIEESYSDSILDEGKSGLCVRITYMHKIIKIGYCGFQDCSVEDFLSFLSKYVAIKVI